MTITPEEQVWLASEAIANAYEITTSGKHLLIHPDTFKGKISLIQIGEILDKLEKDHSVIEIVSRPTDFDLSSDGNGKCYSIKIPDYTKFRSFLNLAHSKHHGSIDILAGDNFFAVCDVSMDILSELQLSSMNVASIPLVPSIIKFNSLCPAHSAGLLDRYANFRWKALLYMKERGHINYAQIEESPTYGNWDRMITVEVDRYNFDKFYKKLGQTYEIRVVEPAKKKEKKEKKKINIPEMPPPLTRVEIVSMPVVNTKSLDEAVIAKNKKIISLPKFHPTEWSKIEWRFLDERNVLIGTKDDLKPSDFQALGFENETTGKPDLTWLWLFDMAIRSGETETLPKPIPDATKQKKLKVSNLLKKLFKNDTDPFYDPAETQTYRLKIGLFPPQFEENRPTYNPMEMLGDLG